MLLRMSTLLLKTLREEPAEAEVPSHRLLLRAGFIRRAAPGGYTWLPLGKLVLDRVTEVARAEMTAIGGQEVSFRDFTPDGTIEAAEVRAGDPCPACRSGTLTIRRSVEIAHIFQLGRRYTDAFQVDVLGVDGKPVRPTMGSYGIGLSRAVAVIAEQHHDERGLLWPDAVAPADVHVLAAGKDGQIEAALALASSLVSAGLRMLVDDRPTLSAGVKFTDAELIGISRSVVVGRRLQDGYAEFRDRRTGERRNVPLADVTRVVTTSLG